MQRLKQRQLLIEKKKHALNFKMWLVSVITSFWLMVPVLAFSGQIIYVDNDAIGLNDGSSWMNAYTFLQDALVDANSSEKPVEIRVAQGTYKPDEGLNQTAGDYQVEFRLINEVAIKGGYGGFGEADPNHRDIEVYETILSGDINGDDVDVSDPCDLFSEPTRIGNSWNVVVGSNTNETAILDGFTITGGHISVITRGGPVGGAGMLIISGSPTIVNCMFTGNATRSSGGGLLLYDNSNTTLLNCRFIGNYAGGGGGVFASKNSSPTLIDCTFSDNFTTHEGGGMLSVDSNTVLTNCIFIHNLSFRSSVGANTKGGGIYNRNSNLVLNDCTFIENSADNGGGMYNIDSNIELNTCEFISNAATRNGGALRTEGGQLVAKGCIFEQNYPGAIEDYSASGSMFSNCTFTGNTSQGDSGAVWVYKATFNNCLFAGNKTYPEYPNKAGGLYAYGETTLTNCTFYGNWAQEGRAISMHIVSELSLMNCILWDGGQEIYNGKNPKIKLTYSNVQGGWEGWGNINEDPLFANPGYWACADDPNQIAEPNDSNAIWISGDYHLKSQAGRWGPTNKSWVIDEVTSPCIDAGDPNSPIALEPFPNGGRINIGAYGGTAEASKSYFGEPLCETIIAGDINGDCKVDLNDFAIMVAHWLENKRQ